MIKQLLKPFLFISIIFMAITAQAQNSANIAFKVSFTEPQAHYADVEMTISNIKKDEITVKMPTWAPGSYLIREFSKNIESFAVNANKTSVPFEKVAKNAWKIKTKGKNAITITYRVYSFEVSVRTSYVDASHAFLSPTGIFMYVDGSLGEPSTVTIEPFTGWAKVSTGLQPIPDKAFTYYAKNFDWLFDSPIEVGNQDVFEFMAAGVRHEVAMVNAGEYDKEKLKRDMAKIVEKETAIFGENPNKYYVFIVHHFNAGGGGLEHLNSTVLGASRNAYSDPKRYQSFLGLVAHEYFHLWNVKRLRPIALGPFNYDEENYTTNLWIAEGFTAYYDNLIVQRISKYTPDEFVNLIQSDYNAVHNQLGNKSQPLSESSFDAWIKQYRPNENSSNTTISYYNKGALIACMLDLAIINNSKGMQSLDDAMRFAYNEFYKNKNRGYTDLEFKAVLEKYAGDNLDQFYADFINGTKDLDFNKYLNYAGLKISERQALKQPSLGVTMSKTDKTEIATVTRNSAAWNAGLNVKDEIIAINGDRTQDAINYISKLAVNDEADFLISRDGLLKTIKVKLTASASKTMQIQQLENVSATQKTVLEKWLSL
ncbi:M61 family metallopeptidase [Pedobacter alpinus]|uniref:M61 family metallopeptidase n=1 Tax=Pedobacter alpinus TaxID=1590643 RepID=A0ABW5TSV8_9SPHI